MTTTPDHAARVAAALALPASYTAPTEQGRLREAAAFVRRPQGWAYHSRGSFTEALTALEGPQPGRFGGAGEYSPDDVRVVLDATSWGDPASSRDLCWGGPQLTVAEFRGWVANLPRCICGAWLWPGQAADECCPPAESEGLMMAGMAHGNRGLADYAGLDLDAPGGTGCHGCGGRGCDSCGWGVY